MHTARVALVLYGLDFSPNVERARLALAHKGIAYEMAWVDFDDRSLVLAVSDQERVPVLEHDARVIAGSMAIVDYLEEQFPEPPLTPADEALAAQAAAFVAWFEDGWKAAFNALVDDLLAGRGDEPEARGHVAVLAEGLDRMEALLDGREFLFGTFSAADIAAYPFVGRAAGLAPEDDGLPELVLRDHQRLGSTHPRLRAWIARLDAFPEGYGPRGPEAA
jgi:glutathione S-transferase